MFRRILPPAAPAPMFTIRKRASMLIRLDQYVADGIMTPEQVDVIRDSIVNRLNIVVSGGTGTGKTTLTNAILAELVETTPEHRLVILEDTAEIQCAAENHVILHTTDTVDMGRLLKSTMRLRPDRIIVGEVRDGAALTLLKAWNTGHPGGIATVHSNSAGAALTRLEQLVAARSAGVQTGSTLVEQFTGPGTLGCRFAQNRVLVGAELCAPLGLGLLGAIGHCSSSPQVNTKWRRTVPQWGHGVIPGCGGRPCRGTLSPLRNAGGAGAL